MGLRAARWTAKVEYLHVDLSDQAFSSSTAAAGGGTASRTVDEGRLTIDTVRLGVNFLLN